VSVRNRQAIFSTKKSHQKIIWDVLKKISLQTIFCLVRSDSCQEQHV
jgi:hypothetical protein